MTERSPASSWHQGPAQPGYCRTTRSPARPRYQTRPHTTDKPHKPRQPAVSGAATGSARETTNHANHHRVLINSSNHQPRLQFLDFQAYPDRMLPSPLGGPQCPDSNRADPTVYALAVSPCLEPPRRTALVFTTVARPTRINPTRCIPNDSDASHLEPPLRHQPHAATALRQLAASDTNHLAAWNCQATFATLIV